MIVQYDKAGAFIERVDGDRALLEDGYWRGRERGGGPRWARRRSASAPILVSTYLSPERVRDALGTAISISFWELPGIIEATEKAGTFGLPVPDPVRAAAVAAAAAAGDGPDGRDSVAAVVPVGQDPDHGRLRHGRRLRLPAAGRGLPPDRRLRPRLADVCGLDAGRPSRSLLSLTVLLHQEDG